MGNLTIDHGVLVWNTLAGGAWTGKVVAPAGPRRAFTFEFTAFEVERGAGDVLTPAGHTLTLLGTAYEESAGRPQHAAPVGGRRSLAPTERARPDRHASASDDDRACRRAVVGPIFGWTKR